MYLTVRGLVIRVTRYNDTDALLTVLTENRGKLTVKARGLCRKNSPVTAPCQLLAFSEFALFEYRDMYTVNEAHAIELFLALRKDLQKLSLGTYFAQVSDVISQEDIPNPEVLSLTLNCLYALTKLQISETLVKAVFELRIACLAGYEPDLDACYHCGNTAPDRFNITQGRLECSSCRRGDSDDIRMPISCGSLDSIRYIVACNSKKLFSFTIHDTTVMELAYATEGYLTTQLERGFSALDFYKTLLIP